MRKVFSLAVLTTSAVLVGSAWAQTTSWEAEATFSGVADSRFEGRAFRGDVSQVEFGARAVASRQFGGSPLFRLGVEWQRYEFDAPARVPIAGTMQSLTLVVGADFQLGDAWLFRLEATPGFYHGGSSLSADGLNVPVLFGGSYFVNADLQWIAGLELDVNRKYPLLGAIGVRWKFATNWVLNAVLPSPRLEYSVGKTFTGYIGANLRETTFRMEEDFGRTRGRRMLDDAVVDYTQVRVGIGATWKVSEHFTLEVEGGVVTMNDLDYHRAEIGVRSEGYPAYGGVSLKAAF